MKRKKIGIVGCGAIGSEVALFIDKKLSKKVLLAALADKNKRRANSLNQKLSEKAKIKSLKNLVKEVDLVVEAASQRAADEIIEQALNYKKDVIILSVGSLVKNPEKIEAAKAKKINLYIPSGAIAGVDALAALAKGNLKKIKITTSKPPNGLSGTQYLKNKNIDLTKITKKTPVFSGNVKEAIKCFPKNINVAATLMLSSQFDKVSVTINADPKIKKNIHKIEIEAKEAKIKIEIKNSASKLNPKTSALTILSTKHLIEKIFSSLKIGS